jgi:hypothetical protein
MKIDSDLTSLAELVPQSPAWHFNIPIYQRLYVWGEDQVLTLLNDLANAYERGAELFFLGGTLLVEQQTDHGRMFDLIDGQQRFTTLWMLCQTWTRMLESPVGEARTSPMKPFLSVKLGDKVQSRLRFAIRPETNRFLEELAFGPGGQSAVGEDSTLRMRTAMALMRSLFEKRPLPAGVSSKEEHLAGLAEFVYTKVQFVVTRVPRETDLNKLFEVINNRGVQLQHHEILKARMLDALDEDERGPYAVLWEACADMENFVERNLHGLTDIPMHEITSFYEAGVFAKGAGIRAKIRTKHEGNSQDRMRTLDDILKAPVETDAADATAKEEEPPMWVRSIFGFPLFLQHVLRIWLFRAGRADVPRLLDRELLELFEKHFFDDKANRSENVRSFIDLLWEIRVIFDNHIIKWAEQGEEEIHLISQISVSLDNGKRTMSRSKSSDSHRGFSLLQSMLYHSQEITTQYWLTPLLLYIYKNPDKKTSGYFEYLRHLDDHLLGSDEDAPLVVRTRCFMEDPSRVCRLVFREELQRGSGVHFAHYWFYKLEFALWFQNENGSDLWKKFRMTAKSSVEHISPQTPTDRDDNKVDQALHHFGNLALVSRSLNSEFGNLPFNEKRQRFKNSNKNRIDSLKMDLIYEHERWNDELAFEHQKQMIDCLDRYYQRSLKRIFRDL